MKIAIMATLYERLDNAVRTIQSIAPQVDEVRVVANIRGNEPVAEWVEALRSVAGNVDVDISDNTLGGSERFRGVKISDAYYFAIDDDLIYPEGYGGLMTRKVSHYKCLVSMHGRRFTARPIKVYYGSKNVDIYRCLHNDSDHDLKIHVPGAGVSAWYGGVVDLRYHNFLRKNMCDVEIARLCNEQEVDVRFIAHPADYFQYMPPPKGTTIHDIESPMAGVEQAKVVNEILMSL